MSLPRDLADPLPPSGPPPSPGAAGGEPSLGPPETKNGRLSGLPATAGDLPGALARITAERWIHDAMARLSPLEPWIRRQQLAVAAIPAPTGGEGLRAEWMRSQFLALGLSVEIDAVGNVLAVLPAARTPEAGGASPYILLTAHLDTAFPPGTAMTARLENGQLRGPSVLDNAAGLAALLALARVCTEAGADAQFAPFLFAADVGEEGEGNLRGMRHLFSAPWAARIAHTLVLDGPSLDITTRALGSRRFQVQVTAPGGHSWADAGGATATHALARIAARLLATAACEPGVAACSIGQIAGGEAINTLAASAGMKVDLRAAEPARLEALAQTLRAAVEYGIRQENRLALHGAAEARVEILGERPAGALPAEAPLRAALAQVDAELGIQAADTLASTDANIPLALGRSALRLGAGGRGGGGHTLQEWFDPAGRALALRRVLLLMALLADGIS